MLSRRWFLRDCPVGMGALAAHQLLGSTLDPTAPKQPHFAPKAKRVVYLFMAGAPSQLELFDHKPQLGKFDGSLPPADLLKGYRAAFINPNSKLMGPKFGFKHYGKSGAYLGELIPHIGSIADDITIVKSMTTDAFNHAPGQLLINTGSQQFGRPSFGAWSIYGLGAETRDLPAFVVFSSGKKGPSGGNSCWGSGFLPTVYQGVQFRSSGDPVLYLSNPPGVDDQLQRDTLDSLRRTNEMRLEATGDPEIETRISSFEMAYRMQSSAPELMDLSQEPKHVLDMYGAEPGKPSFANNCLLARRLLERGVRFVQLYHEAWDQHGALKKDLAQNCKDCDQASAALVKDLKQRGMLEDTIVIWGGEFGRTPMVQGDGEPDGRDHHPNAFTMWMAGGGFQSGLMLGETDELGFNVVGNKVHVHDLHATLLHLLGFDHKRLTYRFQGRDFRLTDVHGSVIPELFA
ncbi:MAG: DUF1501 domain-containing protein [Bryobacterales bacterium]|nr:DUF1501 domain-containing protein [Bryobacterales bacterium]